MAVRTNVLVFEHRPAEASSDVASGAEFIVPEDKQLPSPEILGTHCVTNRWQFPCEPGRMPCR